MLWAFMEVAQGFIRVQCVAHSKGFLKGRLCLLLFFFFFQMKTTNAI